ncbi:MAG: hypothetical protein D6802_09175 [Ardenticatenia bacterium]|nr:MAG: hypothetical protein D6802_09175 [Ardenticatenia bacterium]
MRLDKLNKIRSILLAVLLALLVPLAASAQEGDGVIEVNVLMGTADVALPENLEAELLFLPNGQGPPVITSAPLNADGSVRFEGLDTAPQHVYLVRVTYEGHPYFSELLQFAEGETTLTTHITIYAPSRDWSVVEMQRVNMILDVSDGHWIVGALYALNNPTDRLLVADQSEGGFFIPLPSDAQGLTFQEQTLQEAAEVTPDGVRVRMTLPPGETPLVLSYVLPYAAPEQRLTIPLPGNVPNMRVLVVDLGQTTTIEGFSPEDPLQTSDGTTYQNFVADDALATSGVQLVLQNLPDPSTLPQSPTLEPIAAPEETRPLSERLPAWTGLVVLALALLGVGVYAWRTPATATEETYPALIARRDTLVQQLADLEDRYEAREIGEQAFRQQSAALREELKQILRRLQHLTPQNRQP